VDLITGVIAAAVQEASKGAQRDRDEETGLAEKLAVEAGGGDDEGKGDEA